MVLWFPRCQIPGTHGSLIPKASNTQSWWFFESESFKYPGPMVLWFWKFQIPVTDGSLILKVSNTRDWWFLDSESFKYPGLMVLWFWKFQIPGTDGSLIPKVSNTPNWWFFDSGFYFIFSKTWNQRGYYKSDTLVTLEISSPLSFFLSASTAATFIFTAPTCTTTIITLEPCALNAEFQHFILRFRATLEEGPGSKIPGTNLEQIGPFFTSKKNFCLKVRWVCKAIGSN
jgi:hypothetical protein